MHSRNKSWKNSDIETLKRGAKLGHSSKELAYTLGRSVAAIDQKLAKIRKELQLSGNLEEVKHFDRYSRRGHKKNVVALAASKPKPVINQIPKQQIQVSNLTQHSQQLGEIFNALIVIAIGVWATAAGLFLAVIQ